MFAGDEGLKKNKNFSIVSELSPVTSDCLTEKNLHVQELEGNRLVQVLLVKLCLRRCSSLMLPQKTLGRESVSQFSHHTLSKYNGIECRLKHAAECYLDRWTCNLDEFPVWFNSF